MRAREVAIRLERGRLIVSHSWGEARARLEVTTAHGQAITPSNALFCIEADQAKTRLICATGWIEFTAPHSEAATRVPPGSVGEWPAQESNIAAADIDAHAQEILQRTLEVEETLAARLQQKRNVLPR